MLVDSFNQALSDCDLVDMELIGYLYTWECGRGTDSWIEIRLDRALVCSNWFQRFRMAQLHNLEVSALDHCPLLLEPTVRSVTVPFRQFRFENAWLREPLCRQVVKDSWDLCEGQHVMKKISYCGESLQAWGQDYTSNFQQRISHCKREIQY
ncbi:hypothetical protein CsatB_025822 [Cannabis sativa]|uniref:uncharacterized protein LOC133031190 n=1 Tax=Cannabis sativa TaxID=3483 RepID=UPI0029CA292D|nr:uncharacterized protein LOC133031190 [Cannabis sativa]